MSSALVFSDDRLLPADPATRAIARRLYQAVAALPIISPHGHTDPAWFAANENFSNPAELLLIPDHYLLRMLYSQGISLQSMGVSCKDSTACETNPRTIWRRFAAHYYLFRGTPSHMWLNYVFYHVFGLRKRLQADTADEYYDTIQAQLQTEAFKPRALFNRYNIEVLATTESPLDDLRFHRQIEASDWAGRVITTFRPDPVVDPDYEGFHDNLAKLAGLTGEHCESFASYLKALKQRREFFKHMGATATDHGHPSARTANLAPAEAERLFQTVRKSVASSADAELFRAHMLTEMARMSLDDGLVMQIHPGAFRNHNPGVFARFGRDKGADIPTATHYVEALKPLLDELGNEAGLSIILFTLDETSYSRELAPLAGHYPTLKLGPAWWFHDSPEGMRRFREMTTETAGFYNTVGFNDDTRAFLSIPARHDVARRMDCHFLATLVAEHRLDEDEAAQVAHDLAYGLAKRAYRL